MGIQKSKCFAYLEEAQKWRSAVDVLVEEPVDVQMTFAEAKTRFFEFKKNTVRPSTYDYYEKTAKFLKYFDRFPVRQITAKVIDLWLAHIKTPKFLTSKNHSRMSYEQELTVLRQVLSYYSEYLDDSYQLPLKKRHLKDAVVDLVRYQQAKARNKMKYIPSGDVDRFLSQMAIDSEHCHKTPIFHALAVLQARTGLRIGEACALDWRDVNFEHSVITICKSVQWFRGNVQKLTISPLTKTGEPRKVFVTTQAIDVLKNLRDRTGRSVGLIFSDNGFQPLHFRSIQYAYDSAFKRVGLPWRGTHILRHSFATDFLEKTRNPQALQAQLGHKSSQQTEHYAKITSTLQEEGMRAYTQKLGGSSVVRLSDRLGGGWEGLKENSNLQ